MNDDSASECLSEMLDALRRHKLSLQELCVVYGNLGYSIGASIEGYDASSQGPGPEELMKLHAEKPYRPGIAFMMEGYNITTWADQIEEAAKIEERDQTENSMPNETQEETEDETKTV